MADNAHITLLYSGADVWNQWRIDNPGIFPDLSQSMLLLATQKPTRLDLHRTNLYGTGMFMANLS